jgi:hypothetical protein
MWCTIATQSDQLLGRYASQTNRFVQLITSNTLQSLSHTAHYRWNHLKLKYLSGAGRPPGGFERDPKHARLPC